MYMYYMYYGICKYTSVRSKILIVNSVFFPVTLDYQILINYFCWTAKIKFKKAS